MPVSEKQLAQARENSIDAVSVYSPSGAVTNAILTAISVVNTSSSDATLTIFHDEDGTTYDESTACISGWQENIPAGERFTFVGRVAIANQSGNIAYQSSVANALTITMWGMEISS